jgi:sporulation integral membrane protein YlbJ
LSLCSTSGPLFIIGAVATGILKNPALGFVLTLSHYLSAITVGFFMRFYRREKTSGNGIRLTNPLKDMLDFRKRDGRTIGVLIGDSVKNGVNLILMIGGFIILFSVIASMLKVTGLLSLLSIFLSKLIPFNAITPDVISSFIIGFLEVTNGVKECAALQVPLIYKIIMVSFMIGFGGLSVNAQVMSIVAETDLKFGIYLIVKAVQGIIAALYTYLMVAFSFGIRVFNQYDSTSMSVVGKSSWYGILLSSTVNMLVMLAFILAISFFKTKKALSSKPF